MSLWKRLDPREGLSEEVREEIRFYLEMRAGELEAEGMAPADAWKAAVEAFGDPDDIRKRVVREARMTMWMTKVTEWLGSVGQDLRVAARSFRRDPAFTVVAVATLALGIGASTAISGLAREALFKETAVSRPESLIAVYTTSRRGAPRSSTSYPDYLDYRDRTARIDDLAATALISTSLGDEERGARLLTTGTVTGNYFELLGLVPQAGRLLTPADDRLGEGAPVAVLSHELWWSQYAGDPEVIGSTMRLNGRPFEVVGVAPRGFEGLRIDLHPQLWLPMQSRPYLTGGDEEFEDRFQVRGNRWLDLLVGRLAEGGSVDAAHSELLTVSDRLREENPDARGARSVTVDALDGYILPAGREADFRTFVLLLGGTVGLALLLCSANIANLLLARGSARRRDIGVRLAIGAGTRRVVRQLVTESLLLAAIGGLFGLVVAGLLLRILGRFELPGGVAVASLDVTFDPGTFGLAAMITLATGCLFGLAPALDGSRARLGGALQSGRGARDDGASTRTRKALVATQVALSLVLLVGSGLFVRTLREALDTDLGFRPEELALTRFNLDLVGYGPQDAWAFVESLEQRLIGTPGAEVVTTATRVPLQNGGAMGFLFGVDGYAPAADEEMRVDMVVTTPGYPRAMGISLLDGRDFDSRDGQDAERVALVSRAMADRYWPDGRAVDGAVTVGGTPFRVVGVVGDATWNGLADDVTNFVYTPLAQSPSRASSSFLTVAVRTERPEAMLTSIRTVLGELDRDVSVYYSQTMDDMVGRVLMPQRMGAVLLTGFGMLALVLSIVGIAGVVSYSVSRQRREIALRVALGASKDSILRGVVTSMTAPVGAGVVIGIAAASQLTRRVEDLLFGVSGTDPMTYVVIAAGIVVVSLLATVVPARAATRVDPMEALGAE